MVTVLGANTLSSGGFEVANSCRFDGSSSSMSITPGSNMNLDRWTWSGWIKRSSIGVLQSILAADNAASDTTLIEFDANDKLNFLNLVSNNIKGKKITDRVFRDISAWYHIVVVWDSANSTAADRIKIYVNGVRETSFATSDNPDSGVDSSLGESGVATLIGTYVGEDSRFFNGYLAEVVLIDGSALAPTSFGEFDEDSGIWKPIKVSGLTFGTHGFYLDFQASGNLGNDANGGTDLGESGLAATDQSTDTCTNNFATFNPLVKPAAAIPLSEGNLKGVFPGSWTALPATFGLTKGKWYFEAKNITSGQNAFIGVVTENQKWDDGTPYNETTGVVLFGPGGRKTVDNTSNDGFFATLSSGQIVGVALNLDSSTKTIQFSVNGTDTPNSTPVDLPSTFDDVFIFPYFIGNSSSETSNWELNFGSPPYSESGGNSDGDGFGNFKTAPPSGHFALCTKNLAEYG